MYPPPENVGGPSSGGGGPPAHDYRLRVAYDRGQVLALVAGGQAGSPDVPAVGDGSGELDDTEVVLQGVTVPAWVLD